MTGHFDNEKEFVDFLFDKLVSNTDTEMIDLQDDDTCCDHILFHQLAEEPSDTPLFDEAYGG